MIEKLKHMFMGLLVERRKKQRELEFLGYEAFSHPPMITPGSTKQRISATAETKTRKAA